MKILQLTNYPTSKPVHGGQIRCVSIANELRRAGHKVKSLSVYVAEHYSPDSDEDIPFDRTSKYWDYDLPYLTDYFSGVHVKQDADAYRKLEEIFTDFAPNVVIVEHPWLMPVARLLAKKRKRTRLVYSSHNVEYRLKEDILHRAAVKPERREALIKDIRELEQDAVINADLVITCTRADAKSYRAMKNGANIIVGGNGVEPFACRDARVSQWVSFIARPYPIFVSSAHLPNANGFWDMMSPGLTFLRPDERMVIAGSVCDIILGMEGLKTFERFNLSRLELLGRMEKVELQAAVRASHVVLLPITSGEGSNLKTAEALESGCAIVGTTKAFRGFERAMTLPHVHIADDPAQFRRKVRDLLDQPRYEEGTPSAVRSKFYWSTLLKDAVDAVGALK